MIFEKIRERLEKKRQSYMDEYGMIDIKTQEVFVESRNIINQVEAEYNNGWIPCSERLPVYMDNVLVCTENGGETIAHIRYSPVEWVDMYATKIDNVIAWQPLPKPYVDVAKNATPTEWQDRMMNHFTKGE